ncbi:MAG TPA: hypothetical protein VNJ04_16625 [Gemmatimonadaceae bacterium]|nr:hypothetical protein [Gemmatimonadaceae bacterium]
MRTLQLAALTLLLAGCTVGGDGPPDAKPAAPVSRGANGDCLRAWNSPGNAANRSEATAKHDNWSAALSEWVIDHPAPHPSGDDLVGRGCSYFFYSSTHWRSYSGGWEVDGDLRWGMPHGGGGQRTPEQQLQPPNAVLQQHGKLAQLAEDNGSPVSGREWKAVIGDWYDNGTIDTPHRCAAVRVAIAHIPPQGPTTTTAHEDLREYAEQVCST